jgi:hypothetical protein
MSSQRDSLHDTGSPADLEELGAANAVFRSLFEHLDISDAIVLSAEGTAELGLDRYGYTYGETGLQVVLRILRAADLPSYCCACANGGLPDRRCGTCGLRPAGAAIVDLGSGAGNVVVGMSLLVAGALARASSVRGVELLPTLHRAAAAVVDALHAKFASDLPNSDLPNSDLPCELAGARSLSAPLPACSVRCADLLQHDLSDEDVCYLCSTAFPVSRKRLEPLALRSGVRS